MQFSLLVKQFINDLECIVQTNQGHTYYIYVVNCLLPKILSLLSSVLYVYKYIFIPFLDTWGSVYDQI